MFLKATSLLAAFAVAKAVKDDEYYRPGMGNPNADVKMYWGDAHNVLEDLDQFSYLYVQYHNCAWAQNKAISGDGEGGGSGDETDYWYLDATPTYAANVAFSLYGALDGEKFSGCNADTFINSFTTNQGFEKFAQALYYAGATEEDYSGLYSSECNGGSGVVCDYQYGFAYATFSSDTCDPSNVQSVSDDLSSMNAVFENAQCVQIYDKSTYVSNSYYNNDDANNNRELQEQEGKDASNSNGDRSLANNYNNDDAYNGNYGYNGYKGYANSGYGYNAYANNYYNYYGTALSLLYYSNACFIQNYWSPDSGCPDPYGLLSEYQGNFNKGYAKSMKIDTYTAYKANMEAGKRYVLVGFLLFFSAMVMFISEQMMAFKKKKMRRGGKTGPSTKKKKSVVELVSSTGTKIKKSANKGVKKAVATVMKSKKTAPSTESDGIMVEPPTSDAPEKK